MELEWAIAHQAGNSALQGDFVSETIGREIAEYESKGLKERRSNLPSSEFQTDYDNYIVEDIFSLNELLDILLRRKWIIISCFLIFVIVAFLVSLKMTPMYKAGITIEISPDNPKITSFDEVVELDAPQREYYETQYKLIKSRSLAGTVASNLELEKNPEFNPKDEDGKNEGTSLSALLNSLISLLPGDNEVNKSGTDNIERHKKQALYSKFISRIDIEPDRKSRLVDISFLSSDPEFSAKAANAIGDQYIEWLLDRKLDATKTARTFLKKQLDQVKANLETAEEELNKFAKNSNIVSLDENLNLIYLQLSDLNKALSEAENERLAKEASYNQIKDGEYEYHPDVVNDLSIQALNADYTKAKAEYDNMAVVFGPNYPELKQLGAKVSRIQNDIQKRTEGKVSSIKKDFHLAQEKENILRQRTEEQNKRASELNDKTTQYRILAREVETNKSLHETLLQRYKETEVTSGIKATNVQIVDYASVPLVPHSPNIRLNLVIASFLGLFFGVVISFIAEHFDNTIKDEEELKDRFSIPILGVIPVLQEEDIQSIEKASHLKPLSILSESFRNIRTSVLFSPSNSHTKSILMTSSQPVEGKTTCTSNLAISFAQSFADSNKKVVIVDADMRRPRIDKIFESNRSNGSGLSTYLIGKYSLDEVIQGTDIDHLYVIQSGTIPPNPAELLGSEKMKELIQLLSEEFDIILIDAPPVLGFADSRIISSLVDDVVIVTSAGLTQRKLLESTLDDIYKVNGKILGFIVNRLKSHTSKYRYNYYYSKENENTIKLQGPNHGSDIS